MKVSDLFERLSCGELSNLSIGQDGSGEIEPASNKKLILYINNGLLDIFSRFIVIEKSVIIVQLEHITNYHLKKQFAESSGSDETYHYIKDLIADPFQEDVIKIMEVYDSFGQPRILNDKEHKLSLFTPYPDTLQVPSPVPGQALGISYQARHRVLLSEGDNILKQDIDLPFFLEGALQSYIASKVYSHMNGKENKAIGQEFSVEYEMNMRSIESRDLINMTFSTSHQKLESRGFV